MKEERVKRKQIKEEANDESSNKRRKQLDVLYANRAATLPDEVLGVIFKFFDSAAQLGECRAVCKSWDNPAAKAMYSKQITIKSGTGALKLYRHLFKDPSKIPLIRHMHFELDGDELSFIFEELLRLAFTPTVKRVTGNVKAEKFFTTIFDIVEKSTTEFTGLSVLTQFKGKSNYISGNRLLLCKNSYTALKVRLDLNRSNENWKFVEKLDQFPRLSSVKFFGNVNTLDDLEFALNNCPHLTDLILKKLPLHTPKTIMLTRSTMETRLATNVQEQQKRLTTLKIISSCRPEVLEYLIYKYPNIEKIEITGNVWSPNNSNPLNSDNIGRVLDAIKDIRRKDIKINLPSSTNMKNAIQFFKTRPETASFDVEQIDGESKLVVKIT